MSINFTVCLKLAAQPQRVSGSGDCRVLEGKQNMKDGPHAVLTEISLKDRLKPRSDRYIASLALCEGGVIIINELEKTQMR